MTDLPIEDIAPIFERINSTGTPLTIVDLMRAATWKRDFDLIDSINEILDEVEDKDFHRVDNLVILRTISVAAGGQFNSGSIGELRSKSVNELKSASRNVKEAYKRAVDFVTTQLRIRSSDLVPYANQLAVLTEIFRRIDRPTSQQYRAISEWFWKTSYAGYFAGWSTAVMDNDLREIDDFTIKKSEKLARNIPQPYANIWKLRTFSTGAALTKLFAVLLSHHDPLDLISGQKIDLAKALSWSNAKEFHHFFPKEHLKQNKRPLDQINCLANFVLLTSLSNKAISAKPPSEYLKQVQKEAGHNLEKRLASNLISIEAYEAARKNDFDTFLEIRSQSLHNALISMTDWSSDNGAKEMPEEEIGETI